MQATGTARACACWRAAAESLDRGRRQGHPVQLSQQDLRPHRRQVLGMAQIDRQGLQARTELHRPGHLRREGHPRARPTAGTALGLRPVLGHFQGRRRRQVVHLAPRRGPGRRARQGRPAAAAPLQPVVDTHVDLLRRHLSAGGPRMARLTTRLVSATPSGPGCRFFSCPRSPPTSKNAPSRRPHHSWPPSVTRPDTLPTSRHPHGLCTKSSSDHRGMRPRPTASRPAPPRHPVRNSSSTARKRLGC